MTEQNPKLPVSAREYLRLFLCQGDSTPSVMEKVRRRYIKTKRDDILLAAFDKLLTDLCERPDPGRRDNNWGEAGEVNLLLVLGPSGAGKTRSLKRLFSTHPALRNAKGQQGPLISLSAPSPCGVKELGKAILKATDYTIMRTHVDGPEIWGMIRKRLPLLGVLLIHIDEAQHGTQIRDHTEKQKLLNSLKALMVDRGHPVAFILSGLPEVADFISMDEQVARRAGWISVHSVCLPSDTVMLTEALKSFANLAKLDVSANEVTRLLPRLVHASDNRLGILVEEIHGAIRYALGVKATELKVIHFEKSFGERTGNLPQWNPYARSDYKAVDVWRMLATRDKPDPAVTKNRKSVRSSETKGDRS
ncbi:TniB family NTP-binding protein [Methylobacterium sp. J-059]|uniref:TniB family NTP-binding protein n=1 Tax=Methylobacterium sp. J-059 TaxID=2836643 RepID=UPI001FB9D428|nr:TniB family NTP-binding protein [Methylobacterium sp. J-059]MCJ2042233.1 TniB family NTP-binding protein [Methylobacterium sp. J-059]